MLSEVEVAVGEELKVANVMPVCMALVLKQRDRSLVVTLGQKLLQVWHLGVARDALRCVAWLQGPRQVHSQARLRPSHLPSRGLARRRHARLREDHGGFTKGRAPVAV
jgi:hypothetical protein